MHATKQVKKIIEFPLKNISIGKCASFNPFGQRMSLSVMKKLKTHVLKGIQVLKNFTNKVFTW